MFLPKCVHEWSVLVKCVAQPVTLKSVSGMGADCFERMALGQTTVLVTCSKCGRLENHQMLGLVDS